MLSPLKLSVIVCGAAAGLAVAPYIVKQVLPPESSAATDTTEVAVADVAAPKIDLPIAAPAAQAAAPTPAIVPIATAVPAPAQSAPAQAELQLAAPALPTPDPAAPVNPVVIESSSPELTLPSLSTNLAANSMPAPSMTPAPTSPPKPSPTPEIPYRSEVETAQKLMKELGIDTGKIDGKLGPNTQAAVRKFQKEHDLSVSGEVDSKVIEAMEKAVAALPTPTPVPEKKIEITDADDDAKEEKDEKSVPEADDPSKLLTRKETASASKSKSSAKPEVDPGPVPTLQNMKDVRKIQEQLKLAGTYEAEVDGRWGDLTRAAMREFQEKAGLEVTGKPNKETWLAMHAGVVTPDSESDQRVANSSKSDEADDLEISSADSEPTRSSDRVVVNVNGDGVSDPEKVKPLATPRAVSHFDRDSSDEADDASDNNSPKVKVSTPRETESAEAKSSSATDEAPSDLAVASDAREEQMEKFREEIDRRRAKIQSVSSDSTYEVKKYAPKMLETVNNMVDDLKIETVSNNPAEARQRLAKIDEELERAKKESMKKKADELVAEVRTSYNSLKECFPTRIKCLSLKNEEEKAQREELTELVAKVDLGFEAMEKDLKKENYEPIFKNGKAFCNTIDEINRTMAEVYVTAKLDEKETKKKLKDDVLKEIASLQESEDFMKAADKLQAELE